MQIVQKKHRKLQASGASCIFGGKCKVFLQKLQEYLWEIANMQGELAKNNKTGKNQQKAKERDWVMEKFCKMTEI